MLFIVIDLFPIISVKIKLIVMYMFDLVKEIPQRCT